jgi:hypothetical protein
VSYFLFNSYDIAEYGKGREVRRGRLVDLEFVGSCRLVKTSCQT